VKVRMLGNYAVLQATAEANEVARQNASRKLLARAKDPAIVDREGRDKLLSSGEVVSEMNILRYTEIQFGLYRGQNFHWILENAVGWAVGFLKSYRREGVHNDSPLGVNKYKFDNFCSRIPEIERAVAFSIKVEAANKIVAQTGDDGHRLVEFGRYSDMSWRELYESNDAKHVHFVHKYLLQKTDCRDGSKMDMFRKYCQLWESHKQPRQQASTTAVPESPGKWQRY